VKTQARPGEEKEALTACVHGISSLEVQLLPFISLDALRQNQNGVFR
jgi:hypothetical protein